ncbi:ubiquitin carboxyl-terminal hydrolase 30 [Paragonimus westermani]|uniref:ubiquitinyl hydrolase 1 n=1 Tax=Paragonimus westermani TaxID=34504 RepID=A0A5J4NDI0_9TREM|nr:ubiquitin carboxyl-terminal hydrolase 30 [Paragonimus westermani]
MYECANLGLVYSTDVLTFPTLVTTCFHISYLLVVTELSLLATESDLPMGLPNPHNVCYLNALLQAMSTNASLVRFLKRSARIRRSKLLYCLVCLLKGLRCSNQYVMANNLDVVLRNAHAMLLMELTQAQRWSVNDQQDAHELFSFFMDAACCRQLGHTAFKAGEGLTSVSRFIGPRHEQIVPRCLHRGRVNTAPFTTLSPLRTEVFQQNLLANQVTCTKCDYRSSPVLQPEACLTVFFDASSCIAPPHTRSYGHKAPIVPSNSLASVSVPKLTDCLSKQFGTNEPLPDVYCPKCQSATREPTVDSGGKGLCQQERWIAHLPPCLVLHVQRGAWLGRIGPSWNPFGFGTKRSDFLAFPYRLDMTSYVLSTRSRVSSGRKDSGDDFTCNTLSRIHPGPPRTYVLRSVLVHQGESIHSGHYIACRAWRKGDPDKHRRESKLFRFVRYVCTSVFNFFHGISHRNVPLNASPWIFTSDTYVLRVPSDEVRSCLAYLLFYEQDSQISSRHGGTGSCPTPSDECKPQIGNFRSTLTSCVNFKDLSWEQSDGTEKQRLVLMETSGVVDEEGDSEDDVGEDEPESDEPSDTGDEDYTGCSKADVIRAFALAATEC